MKKRVLWLLLPLLAACQYDFSLGEMEVHEKMVLYCMPSADDDTTLIALTRSLPVTQKGKAGQPVKGARIAFRVNGAEQVVHYADTATGRVPAGNYYVVGRWHTGDRVDVEAMAEALPGVEAHSVVPEPFPLKQVRLERKLQADPMLQLQVLFHDSVPDGHCYGVRVLKRMVEHDVDGEVVDVYTETPDVYLDNEPLLNQSTGLDAALDLFNNQYGNLYIWDNRTVEGREYMLRLNVPDDELWDDAYRSVWYQVCCYALSPEMYAYLKTYNDVRNNELGHKGLAPIRSHYTNVTGGIGVLGCCRRLESEWIVYRRGDGGGQQMPAESVADNGKESISVGSY